MTLTDVYCRFNRARGMEVCFLSVSLNFSPSSRKSFDIPQVVYEHFSFLFGSLSPVFASRYAYFVKFVLFFRGPIGRGGLRILQRGFLLGVKK